MTNTSSAKPDNLTNYYRLSNQLDEDLRSDSNQLKSRLQLFNDTCREPGFCVDVSSEKRVIDQIISDSTGLNNWVNEVGRGFKRADTLVGFLRVTGAILGGTTFLMNRSIFSRAAAFFVGIPSWLRKKVNSLPWVSGGSQSANGATESTAPSNPTPYPDHQLKVMSEEQAKKIGEKYLPGDSDDPKGPRAIHVGDKNVAVLGGGYPGECVSLAKRLGVIKSAGYTYAENIKVEGAKGYMRFSENTAQNAYNQNLMGEGDFLVWDSYDGSSYGHVAMVLGQTESGNLLVLDQNGLGKATVRVHEVELADYIHFVEREKLVK